MFKIKKFFKEIFHVTNFKFVKMHTMYITSKHSVSVGGG